MNKIRVKTKTSESARWELNSKTTYLLVQTLLSILVLVNRVNIYLSLYNLCA